MSECSNVFGTRRKLRMPRELWYTMLRREEWNMPYTVQKHDDSLELAAKFFATPEGFDFFLKECEKLRAHRAEELRQKELASK